MKKHHAIALGAAVAAALLVTASCGNKEVEEDTLTRLSQAVEGNYVDTMILRLTDFRRQVNRFKTEADQVLAEIEAYLSCNA